MKKRNMMISAVLVSVLLASGSSFAERPGQNGQYGQSSKGSKFAGFMPKGPAFKRAQMALKLQLTSEQRTEIRDIHRAAGESKQANVDQLVLNREQIKTLAKAEPYDESQVQAIATTQGELISQLIVMRASTKVAVRAVLTAEQKGLLDQDKIFDMEGE